MNVDGCVDSVEGDVEVLFSSVVCAVVLLEVVSASVDVTDVDPMSVVVAEELVSIKVVVVDDCAVVVSVALEPVMTIVLGG